MVNRILIRVKVVQMLYAYLLTRSEFRIDSAPEAPSRDKRFAYSVYLDLLQLIIELSGSSAETEFQPCRQGPGRYRCHKECHAPWRRLIRGCA